MLTAPVNKILPYSVVDGIGNRVAIFFQGCNIHCAYCHNPETQRLCINCGECIHLCPVQALSFIEGGMCWDERICCGCDTCIKACGHNASPKVKYMTPEEVYTKVCESIPFIRGITVSGGECSLYPEFLEALFTLTKARGLSCLMDCNGATDLSAYPDLLGLSDGVMLDIKAWDKNVYRALTGADNKFVEKNLKYLYKKGKLTEVRIVVVPDRVDAEACIKGVSSTLGKQGAADTELKLIRFRCFGVKGELADSPSPSEAYMDSLLSLAYACGFRRVMIL